MHIFLLLGVISQAYVKSDRGHVSLKVSHIKSLHMSMITNSSNCFQGIWQLVANLSTDIKCIEVNGSEHNKENGLGAA